VLNPDSLPGDIECRPLKHSILCYGYRLESDNKIVAYCTDTGVCTNLIYLAKKSDLFITECSYKTGQANEACPHLNPASAAKVAKASGAKKMVLIHFDASLYLNFKHRAEARKVSKKIFQNTLAGRDNMRIDL
jgi:ribonuclease BN (tRNA processing enzyme)